MDLRSLLSGPPEDAAPRLLGSHLVSDAPEGTVVVRIGEVEAYKGSDDPASHAFRGRTDRNGSMFEAPGTLYVYRSYGVHWCANVAAGPAGTGWGILFRGGEVSDGNSLAQRRRGRVEDLANGPGKLTQALGIVGGDNGTDLLAPDSAIRLTRTPAWPIRAVTLIAGPASSSRGVANFCSAPNSTTSGRKVLVMWTIGGPSVRNRW